MVFKKNPTSIQLLAKTESKSQCFFENHWLRLFLAPSVLFRPCAPLNCNQLSFLRLSLVLTHFFVPSGKFEPKLSEHHPAELEKHRSLSACQEARPQGRWEASHDEWKVFVKIQLDSDILGFLSKFQTRIFQLFCSFH